MRLWVGFLALLSAPYNFYLGSQLSKHGILLVSVFNLMLLYSLRS